jgi:uncharacterized protein (TIGR02246 family)
VRAISETTPGQDPTFDATGVLAAVRLLEAALQDPDPLAWVDHYTDDAVFDGGGEHAVEGREALLAMAAAMLPLSSVSIRPLRTQGHGDLAVVWCAASWVSGDPADSSAKSVDVRGLLCLRRGRDGRWLVALEHLG